MEKLKFVNGGGYNSSGQRDKKIDLLKGMGIILMVFRHTEAPLSEFVLLFHMAVFFIASGYLFNQSKITDFRSLIGYTFRKIKSLWLPYFLFSSLFVLIHNLLLHLSFITDNPQYLVEHTGRYAVLSDYYTLGAIGKGIIKAAFFMGGGEQLGGALWFFQALFFLTVGYAVIGFTLKWLLKSDKAVIWTQCGIAIGFLLLGYYLHIKGIFLYGLNRFFSFYCLIFIGQVLKLDQERVYKRIKPIAVFCAAFILLLILRPLGYIDLSGNNIENPIYFLAVSLLGWFMMYSLAIILEKKAIFANELITYISKRSVSIVGLHFLAFKLVNCLAVAVYDMPIYMRAGFPVLAHGWWWTLYMAVGIAIPLAIDWIYLRFKSVYCFL